MVPRKTLIDVLPVEFRSYEGLAWQYRDVEVVERREDRWPGRHKNVVVWFVLANGKAVGWNENTTRGWSFPVISYP